MTAQIQSISSINQRATRVLLQEIGVADTIRFLNQFRTGSGDYTTERRQIFEGVPVSRIVEDMQAHRQSLNPGS